jgi:hypothetical protein
MFGGNSKDILDSLLHLLQKLKEGVRLQGFDLVQEILLNSGSISPQTSNDKLTIYVEINRGVFGAQSNQFPNELPNSIWDIKLLMDITLSDVAIQFLSTRKSFQV